MSAAKRQRGLLEQLLTIVHGLEVAALAFGALAVWGVTRDWPGPAAFAAVVALLIFTVPLLGRSWGWLVSLVCQLALSSLTFIEPVMGLVALAFVAMWIFCFVRARQIERGRNTPA